MSQITMEIVLDRGEQTELHAWRVLGGDVAPLLERVIAAQGDAAEPEIVRLQHRLADLNALRQRAGTPNN